MADAAGSRDLAFEECQTFPSWMGPALIALSLPALLVTPILIFADEGVTLESTAIVVATVVIVVAPLPFLLRSTLHTEVREDGVYFRYWPFHRSYRHVPFSAIQDVRREERRSYSYGLRWTRSGWEYAPDSSEGIRIYRENSKPIFLGSERPHDLLTAIESGRRNRDRRRD